MDSSNGPLSLSEGADAGRLQLLPDAVYRALTDEMPQMVWSTRPDGYHDYYNRRWYEFTGVQVGSTDGTGWNGMFHPDDQEHAWRIWRESLATGKPYEVEYRLRHHSGEYRWILGLAMPIRNDNGEIVRWIGTCTDIHDRKLLMQRNELLNLELSHRIKNIFSVVGALIRLSAAGQPDHAEFARILRDRIDALGRAHEFVRPHSEQSRLTTANPTLFGMLHQIFSAYPAYRDKRLTVDGDDIEIDDQAATPLALVFHELATNALKYGALRAATGGVKIFSELRDSDLKLTWSESGAVVPAQLPKAGFGSQLMEISVVHQMGGALTKYWGDSGLCVEMKLPRARVRR